MARLEDVCEILDSKRIPITASEREPGPYPYYGANGIQDHVAGYIFDDELVLLAEDGGNFGSAEKPIAYRVSGKCWVNNHAHVLKPKEGLNVDYLCYSLMHYDVSGLVNGATRQKLTQADMRKMEISVPPLGCQHYITDVLNRIVNLISLRKQQLAKLDELVKARFVEMFGDPVANPRNLDIVSLSKIAEFFNGLTYTPSDISKDGTIVLRSSNIRNGMLDFTDTVRVSCAIKDKYMVQDNDILMCSRNGSARLVGKVAPINNISEPMCFGAFMMIVRSKYAPYLLTYFQTDAFREQIKTGATTTINQITVQMLGNVYLPIPTIQEIEEYSGNLNHIEKCKLTIRQGLDKLEMLKKALMQEYFGG